MVLLLIKIRDSYQSSKNSSITPQVPIRLRVLVLGLVLSIINVYWVIQAEGICSGWGYTTFALLANAIATLLVLVPLNLLVARLQPRWVLFKAELLLIYAMVMIASGIGGFEWAEALPSVMSYTARVVQLGADTKAAQVQDILPPSLVLPESADIRTLYEGAGSLYHQPSYWQPWLRPLALWTVFLGMLVALSIAVSALLRKQWIAHERLSFPLLALPIALCEPKAPLLRNRLFWLGVALAGTVDLFTALNAIYPSIPAVHFRFAVPLPNYTPWNRITPINFNLAPIMIGICWFAPTALQFSVWVFFLLHVMETLIAAVVGYSGTAQSGISFTEFYQQAAGGMVALAIISIYTARHHLRDVLRSALTSTDADGCHYRIALAVVLVTLVGLLLFTTIFIRIPVVLAAVFLVMYVAAYIGLTRLRAELGPPMNGLYAATPGYFFMEVLGPRVVGMRGYTGFNILWWIERDVGQHPMAQSMEGMKLATESRASFNIFAAGMFCAAMVGFIASIWMILHYSHQLGLNAKMVGMVRIPGVEVYSREVAQINFPAPVNGTRLGLFLGGGVFVTLLAILRTRFFGFPLHPVGFILANIWGNFWTFGPFLLCWIIKVVTLRYGGLQTYRYFSFFFLGLIAGECITTVFWLVFQMISGHPMPPFFP